MLNRKWLVLLQLVLSVGILAYLLREIPFDSLYAVAIGASVPLLLIGTIAMLPSYWLDGVQMMWALTRQHIATGSLRVLKINLITMFYSLFLPTLIAGGAIRWYHFSKIQGKPTEALAAILFNRVLEVLLIVTVGVIALVLDLRNTVELNTGLTMVAALGIASLTYVLAFNRRVHEWGIRLLDHVPLPELVHRPVLKLLNALSGFDSMGAAYQFKLFSLGIFRHFYQALTTIVLALALQIDVGILTILWIRSLVALLVMMPISIAGLGIREATFVVSLAQYGVPGEKALALSLLIFARAALYGLVGGIIEGFRVFGTKKQDVEVTR